MSTILVVDDLAIFRDPIAASLRLAGYETLTASDGEEAQRVVRDRRPDLILLDLSMPRTDGITFLRALRAEPATATLPVILLTALSEKKHVMAAASLGIHEYLLKSRFRLRDLLERIEKHLRAPAAPADVAGTAGVGAEGPPGSARAAAGLAASPATPTAHAAAAATHPLATGVHTAVSPLLSRSECIRRAEQVLEGKTLSGVITQVISLANSPHSDAAQLAALIARDSMLSMRVLQAANSAAFASRGGMVTNIPDAIRKVGSTSVRNIAAALGIFEMMPENSDDGFNPIRCWVHSFAVAQLCERLAAMTDEASAGLAYVVGLCHDLGDIFVHTRFAAEYKQVSEAVARTGRTRDQVQREMLGITHGELIAVIFKCLALPDLIRKPIETLHSRGYDRASDPMARILWMAENYANGLMLGSSANARIAPLSRETCEATSGTANPPRPESEPLRAEVLCMTAMLARLSSADEAQLMAPLFKPTDVKVWLARDPTLSKFDPVETALQSLATVVEVHDRLPIGPEADDVARLVILSRSADTPGFTSDDVGRSLSKCRRVGPGPSVLSIVCTAKQASGTTATTPARWVELADLAAFVAAPATATPAAAA